MVSVIIPAYNRGNTIRKAAESVLEQTYKDIELIIVDDGSTDNTDEVLKEIQKNDKRVIVCKHDHNRGACAARNTGILNSKGDYIAFQDSDDIWMRDKLEKQMNIFEKEDIDICFCKMKYYKNGKINYMPTNYVPGIQGKINTVFGIGTQTLLIKRSAFLNDLFDENMPRLQEFELMMRLVGKYKVYYLDIPLVQKESSNNSISKQNEALINACDLILEKHPNFKLDYSFACFQIARVLIRDAFGENKSLRLKMILKGLELDCSIKILIRIPYYFLFRNYDK